MIADAAAIARTSLVLELRRREAVLGMAQFVLSILVIVHFALGGDRGVDPRAAAGTLWAAILLTALLGLQRAFSAEHEEGAIDALLLAPLDRSALWLGKALAQVGFLLAMELIAVPAFWVFFFQGDAPRLAPFLAAIVLADVGIAATGVIVAALARAGKARDVLLPVLLLPLTIPLVIAAVTVTLAAFDGDGTLRGLGFLALYDTIFVLLAWGTFEHLVGD